MCCKYYWYLSIVLLSASLPWQAAVARSFPAEDASSPMPKVRLTDIAATDSELLGTAEETSVGIAMLGSMAMLSEETREVNPVEINLLEKKGTEATLAGLPFTDLELRETTINNTGGTIEPWLTPDTTPSEHPDSVPEEPFEEPPLELRDLNVVSQTPRVDELSDVDPDNWAFQALRSLVDEYQCIAGYPDNTFRGDQPTTRFEFAAVLSSCLNTIVELEPQNRDTVAGLRQRFAPELQELEADVEALESVVTELRGNQFSSTTRLFGQAIFGFQGRGDNTADFFPVDGVADTDDPGAGNVTFFSNAQLFLLSRLSRRDLLFIGLQAGNGNSLFDGESGTVLGLTNNIRLAYEADTDFDVELSDLTYRRLIGDSFALIIGAEGVNPISVFRGPSEAEGAGSGPLSLFAQRNPILSIGNGDTGIGFDWQILERLSLQGVYAVSDANRPDVGIFEGDRTLGFQLTASPFDSLNIGLNYINDFSESGSLGTGIGDSQLTAGDAITTNAFGGTIAWEATPRFTIGGWGGYTISVTPGESGSVNTVNWMAFLNFPDLFGPGHLGGFYIGQPPRITDSDLVQGQNIPDLLAGGLGDPGDQPGSTLHIEAFYRYQLTDNISLTPGFIVLLDPANTPDSDNIVIGALRTTFRF